MEHRGRAVASEPAQRVRRFAAAVCAGVAYCAALSPLTVREGSACAAAVRTHPVLITRGTLTLHAGRLEFTVEQSAHDLRHLGLDPDEPQSWDKAARALASTIAVLNERGDRVPVTVVDAKTTGTRLVADVGDSARFVTLQLRPGEAEAAGAAAQHRQVHLEWTPPVPGPPVAPPNAGTPTDAPRAAQTKPEARTLRLTTGGNCEVLILRRHANSADQPPGQVPVGEGLFDRVWLTIGQEDRGDGRFIRVVRCSVPLPLLQTWPDMAEPRTDALSVEQIKSLEARATAWLAAAVRLEAPSGTPITATVQDVRIVRPDVPERRAPKADYEPLNRWSARLTAAIVPREAHDEHWMCVFWTAFNPSVGTVDVYAQGRTGELRASQCGLRYPKSASSLAWTLLNEGWGPAMPTTTKP